MKVFNLVSFYRGETMVPFEVQNIVIISKIFSCTSAVHPSASGNHWSAFYHYGIVRISRIARKWNLIPRGLLCLSSHTKPNNSESHPRCCIRQQLVPFYYWALVYCMDRLHFVYPVICQWTLGSFQLWDTMNNSVMNIF